MKPACRDVSNGKAASGQRPCTQSSFELNREENAESATLQKNKPGTAQVGAISKAQK